MIGSDSLQWIIAFSENKVVFGAFTAIVGAVGMRVMGHVSAGNLQKQEYLLRQKERLFERRMAAVDAFLKLENKLRPSYRPGMDWSEACEDFAEELGRVAHELECFLEEHTVGLKPAALEKLKGLPGKAQQNSFFALEGPDDVPPKESIEAASEILTALREARSLVLENVSA